MSVLTGLTSGAVEVPVEIDGNGRLVVEGLVGETGLPGPPGPPGPAGQGSSQGAAFWFAGLPWVATTSVPTQFSRIVWCSGYNLFIASGYNASNQNRLATSTDGITYTNRLSYAAASGMSAYSAVLNRVVHTTGSGIRYSNDGINWSNTNLTTGDYNGVAYSPSLGRFAALLYSSTGPSGAAYSADGITWTVTSLPTTGSIFYVCLTWASGINKFVAVPYIGGQVATSSDGITWTKTAITSSEWKNVIWVQELGLLVAVSQTSPFLATSPDGTTWTNRSVPSNSIKGGVAYSPELGLLLVAGNNTGMLASRNGINYTTVNNGTTPSQNLPASLGDLIWAPERFQFAGVDIARATTLL